MSWAERLGARMGRRGEERGRSLCVTNFPQVNSSHISDLLPRCAPQLSSPIIKITPPVIILVKSYLKHVHQLLPVAAEAQVELPFCGFFSFSLYQFTASWLERFLLGWSLKVLVCFSEWFFSAAAGSLISDKSSNLCKLKPCQMELKGLSVCQI